MYPKQITKSLSSDLESINEAKDKEIARLHEESNDKSWVIKPRFSQHTEVQHIIKNYKRNALFNQIKTLNASFKRKSGDRFNKQNDIGAFNQIEEKSLIKTFFLSNELCLRKTQINMDLAEKWLKALKCAYDIESIKDSYLNRIDLNAHKKLRSSIIDFLTDDIKELLYNIILESKNSDLVNQAASNAITLLNKSGFSFTNKDLSRIKIPNADLSFGLFINTNFESSYLYGVNFSRANIYDSNFRNCNMFNANFGVSIISGFKDYIEIIKFSPCGRFLAIAGFHKIYLCNAKNYQKIKEFTGYKWNIFSLLFSNNGEYLASIIEENKRIFVFVWDTSYMPKIISFSGIISSIDFSPYKNTLCLVCKNKNEKILKICDMKGEGWSEVRWLDQDLKSVFFLGSGEKLIAFNENSVSIWNLSTKTKLNKLAFSSNYSSDVSLNRKYIVISDEEETALYSAEKLEKIVVFNVSSSDPFFSFSPCGRYLLIEMSIYDLRKDKIRIIISEGASGFSLDGKVLITAQRYDNIAKSWNISLNDQKNKILLDDWKIQMISFSQHSKFFAIASLNEIFIFLIENQKCFKRFRNENDQYVFIAISDSALASVLDKNIIKIRSIYDESACKLINTNLKPISFKFSADDKKIAVSDEKSCIDILDIDCNLIIFKLVSNSISANLRCLWFFNENILLADIYEKYIKICRADYKIFKIEDKKIEKHKSISISCGGSYLISAGIMYEEDSGKKYIISVWDLRDMINFGGEAIKVKEILTDCEICSILLSNDRDRIIASNKEGKIIVWDYISEKIYKNIKALGKGRHSIDFLVSENFIISENHALREFKLLKFDRQ